MKKSERLIYLLQLMSSGRPYTARELARRCSVSIRTIYRDITDLSLYAPLYYEDGYRILKNNSLSFDQFSRKELLAIKLSLKLPPISESPYLAAATESALFRIEDLLSESGGEVPCFSSSVDIKIDTAPMEENSIEFLKVIENAIEDKKRLEAVYRSVGASETARRELAPVGIAFRRRNWYLVAYCFLREDYRIFRINRFDEIRLSEKGYTPGEKRLSDFFEDAWELAVSGKTYEVVAIFNKRLSPMVETSYSHRGEIEKLEDGRTVFRVTVKGLFEISRWLLRFGGGVEVVEPKELMDLLRNEATELAEIYGVFDNENN